MSRQIKPGGPTYVPASRGGLSDPRSTGGSTPQRERPVLNDRRSTH
jgi:hypothetical protein